MIRTQLYLEEQIRKDLMHLAHLEKKSMTEVARDILKEGIKKRKTVDTSGKKTLQKLFEIKATGGDDPYLSENIDHYLYGTPRKRS